MNLSPLQVEDTSVFDVTLNLFVYPAMLVAHRIGLFQQLAGGSRSLQQITHTMQLNRRPLEALLNMATALGFIRQENNVFSLTQIAEDYLLQTGPVYFGHFWDLMMDNYDRYSIHHLENAIRKNSPQTDGEKDIFKVHEQQLELGRRFTLAMHSLSKGHASIWPTKIDLSNYKVFLDVGGGSGIHAIGAVTRFPNLNAIIFDLPEICKTSDEFIATYHLKTRITTHSGNMWKDSFPRADVHFYGNVIHDWTPEKAVSLITKSFDALPDEGRILLHEVLYNDNKTNHAAAAFSIMMLGWTEGEQYSGKELQKMLTDVGFKQVQVIGSAGHYSLVTGMKMED